MEFITEQDVYDYLGIDYVDDMVARRVRALIETVDSYLTGAIGKDYAITVGPESLAKAREVGLMLIAELYDSRGATDKDRAAIKGFLSSLILQLQLDYAESEMTREIDYEGIR